MKNDVNFRENLIIRYLVNLTKVNNREVFDVYYGQVSDFIQNVINNPSSVGQLEDVRRIVEYKQNKKALEM